MCVCVCVFGFKGGAMKNTIVYTAVEQKAIHELTLASLLVALL